MHRDVETGEILAEELHGCSSSPCFPLSQDVDGFKVKIDCCDEPLCNSKLYHITKISIN